MKKYLSLLAISLVGLTACQKDPMPGDMFNKLDGTYFGYQVYYGLAPVLDVSDQGYADLFITFDLDGGVTMDFQSYGGTDPNSGGEPYWGSQTYYGEYWRNEDKTWHIQFGNYDTLHVTANRKFALDWTNGDYEFSEVTPPSGEDRKTIALTALSGENMGATWTIIWYSKVGWLKARTAEDAILPTDTYYR